MGDFRSDRREGRGRSFGGNSRGGFGGGRPRFRDRDGDGGRDGGRGFGGRPRFGGRDRDSGRGFERKKLEMFEATCDKCKKQCQVPFQPKGGKPVYCSDCFRTENPEEARGKGNSGASGISQEQFKQLNVKLDKILKFVSQLEFVDEEGEEEMDDDEEGEIELEDEAEEAPTEEVKEEKPSKKK